MTDAFEWREAIRLTELHHLRYPNQYRRGTIETILRRGQDRLGLRTRDGAARRPDHRLLYEFVVNALDHAAHRGSDVPCRISAIRDGDHAVWTISDDGPGILAGFLASDCARGLGPVDDATTLLELIHDHISAFCGDPSAGSGLRIALDEAGRADASLVLETDGRRLVLGVDGRMSIDGTTDRTGTTWTARIPMVDVSVPWPPPPPAPPTPTEEIATLRRLLAEHADRTALEEGADDATRTVVARAFAAHPRAEGATGNGADDHAGGMNG